MNLKQVRDLLLQPQACGFDISNEHFRAEHIEVKVKIWGKLLIGTGRSCSCVLCSELYPVARRHPARISGGSEGTPLSQHEGLEVTSHTIVTGSDQSHYFFFRFTLFKIRFYNTSVKSNKKVKVKVKGKGKVKVELKVKVKVKGKVKLRES
jgi:hypothetical protein